MPPIPLYTSKRTAKSLWQEYRIYPDHLELQAWVLFHTIILPCDNIQTIEICPEGWRGFKGMTLGVKIDNCDLCRHVLLTKKTGLFKGISFTPDDPGKFVEVCISVLPL
jgi:hypothetical protein